jgi:hypothetical protein
MSSIPGNSLVVVVVGDAQSAFAQSPSDVLSSVTAYLNGINGAYTVQKTDFSGGMFATVSPIVSETFQATITLTNNYTQDSSQIYSDVQNAFNVAASGAYTPNQITIPSFTPLPGSAGAVGTPVPTGQPAPTPTAAQAAAAAAAAAGSGIQNQIDAFFKGLTTTGTNLLIGLAAIIVLTLILIAYGPNIGKIASAA